MYILSVILLFIVCENVLSDDCSSLLHKCEQKKHSDECVQEHYCCNFCYDDKYNATRCSILDNLQDCPADKIALNGRSELLKVTHNKEFTDYTSTKETVQMKPQEFKIILRKGEPLNLTFQYRSAKNYPLEVYYLLDLSYTMKQLIQNMTVLGGKLAVKLETLTENHKIALGSFMDKVRMPYYLMDEYHFDNPCRQNNEQCERGYSFKNVLNFTEHVPEFNKKLNESQFTANLDNLDGALDAIMQIILCKEFGWTENSRKLIVIPSDSMLHFEGDGKLSGTVQKCTQKCLMKDTNELRPNDCDYPSLPEVRALLEEHKMNLVFITKEIDYYTMIKDELLGETVFIGPLSDSASVLDLVANGYYNYAKQANFFINMTNFPELRATFFADCDKTGRFTRTKACYNIAEGESIDFKVQLELKQHVSRPQDSVLEIEERNIKEKIRVSLDYVGSMAECFHYTGPILNCVNGEFRCGSCKCDEAWTGEICDKECEDDFDKCRAFMGGEMSTTCMGRGDCICGKCKCDLSYQGSYCEEQCPINNNKICSEHGICRNETCECDIGYSGITCSCSTSTANCVAPGSNETCSDNGDCTCNKCNCKKNYGGNYCELCSGDQCDENLSKLCIFYADCVSKYIANETTTDCLQDFIYLKLRKSNGSELLGDPICNLGYSKDGRSCTVQYSYILKSKTDVDVMIGEPYCYRTPTEAGLIYGLPIIAAILLGGLIIALAWKGYTMRKDKIEYARFEEEQKRAMMREENPIYKNPNAQYENIMMHKMK